MQPSLYLVNSRPLSAFSELETELQYTHDKNYLFDLSYLESIQVHGENARNFLQGQLTCDVNSVSATHTTPGALCNLKGRVLALFDIIESNNHLHLILPADLINDTIASLQKPALFSRVTLQSTNYWNILGFKHNNSLDLLPFSHELPLLNKLLITQEGSIIYNIGDQFYILLVAKQNYDQVIQPFIQRKQWRGSLAWHDLQLQHKKVQIYPESRGLFLPHRLELHLSEHISFNKGCYKGQEIIARIHYRSQLKHNLYTYILQSHTPLLSGQILPTTHQLHEPELIDYCPLENNHYRVTVSAIGI